MYELERLLSEISSTDTVSLNGVSYAVKNCIAAASEDTLKMTMYVVNSKGKLLKISVESVDLLKGY